MGFFWDRPFLGILISDRQKLLVPTNKPLFFFVAIYITLVCCARYRSGKQSTSYLHPIPPLLMPFIRLLVPWMPSVAGISTSIIAQKIIEHGRFPQMYLVKTWTRYIYIVYIYYMDNYVHSMWYGLVWSPISQQESQAWTYVYISTKGLMTITQSIIIVAKPTFYIFVPHVWLWISQVHWPYGKSTSSSCYKSFHIISISCSYDADHSWDFPYLLDLFPCFKDIPWRPSKLPGPIAIHIICSAVLLCMTPGTLQILWLEVLALSSGRKS